MPLNEPGKLTLLVLLALLGACAGGNNSSPDNASTDTSSTGSATSQQSTGLQPASTAPSASYEPKSIRLSWNAPTVRVDGSALPINEIGGYEITYINSGNTVRNLSILNPLSTGATLDSLSPDTYQVYVFTFDQQNKLSPASAVLTIELQRFLRN